MIRAALIGLAVAAVVLGATIGLRAERLLGASAPTIELVATVPGDAPLGACERAWRARLRAYDIKMRVVDATDETTILRIAVRGAAPRDADALADALVRPGTLGFHWVDSDAAVSRAWLARFDPAQGARADGVGAATDGWSDQAGATHQDAYLTGPTPAAITAALAEVAPDLPVPDGRALVFERVPARTDGVDRAAAPTFRSYLVEAAPFLTQADVVGAAVAPRQYDGQLEVRLTWSDRGAAVFGEQTAARRGAKLAIVIDGAVASAPVVLDAIRGREASITMGAGDPATLARDAVALARSLDSAGVVVPPGVAAHVVSVRAGDASDPWLVRGGLAALAGLAAAAAALWRARRR